MKIDKFEISVLLLAFFLAGFEIGLVVGSRQAVKSAEPVSLSDVFTINYYTLYDSKGKKIGYQRIDFEGIYYSTDGHNWSDKPIEYIRKERMGNGRSLCQ